MQVSLGSKNMDGSARWGSFCRTMGLSGPEPQGRSTREADDKNRGLAGRAEPVEDPLQGRRGLARRAYASEMSRAPICWARAVNLVERLPTG